jgi:hypothetical protein
MVAFRVFRTCRVAIGLLLVLLSSTPARSQSHGEGFVAFGVGEYSNPFASGHIIDIAGGGELVLLERIGAGAELGLAAGGGDIIAVTCASGSAHFRGRQPGDRFDPFIKAGYAHLGALTDVGASNGWNVGGGVTYWYKARRGIRIEFQDVLYHSLGSDQLWVLRVGFAFR